LNDSAEEAACLEALQAAEADPLPLEFELIPHVDRRVRKFGLHRRVFTTRLVQRGGALRPELIPRDQLPSLLEQALQIAIQRQVLDQPGVHENDHLMINMSSNRLQHAYQSSRVRVRDWLQDTEPAQMMLQQMSNILNSNENFAIDDSFHIEVSHIRDSGVGSGSRGQRPGTRPIEQLLKNKTSVVRIENNDDLCCARALVTAKTYRDWGSRDDQYLHIRKGGPLQEQLARQLHRRARVPEGPCGLGELNLFQIVLADYQIVVVSADHGYQIIFKGPRQPEDKLLCLLKVQDHYHVCHSLSGFFGKAYFCLDCEKSFNSNDLQHHRCPGRKCASCHQAHCRDFSTAAGPAAVLCRDCKRFFFGADCLLNHQTHTSAGRVAPVPQASLCSTHKRCPNCQVLCKGSAVQRHKCGYGKCPSCKEQVPTDTHRCYIQPIVEQARPIANLREETEPDETTNVLPHPLFLYFDIEARQETGEHVANLLCAETSESHEQFTFRGESCIEAFLDWAQTLTRPPNSPVKRQVICLAHNFKGYDSYFILEQCYKQYVKPDQLVNGAKILSLSLAGLRFLDSLSFLPMPLAAFPKAFGLQELKKGFFPHFFNTQDHQDYVGPIPAQDYYDPQGMSPARKEEFCKWHAERRAEHYEFHFQEELLSYCQSDVRLLKEGCTKFAAEFEQLAGFNPFEHCVTIASACNRFFRKHFTVLPPYGLYLPVLPYRAQGKLLFPLCRACVEAELVKPLLERSSRCSHTDAERALTGTWCTIELKEALAQGYDVLQVHEIWHFPHTSTQLFAQYINTFLKIKQEADGWPASVGTDELKRQEYIAAYLEHEGVQLEYAQIEKNPAKRALAKLMLNSFWGKFGQASNKSQVEAISSPAKFHQLLNQDDVDIHAIRVVNEEMLEIVYNKITEATPIQPHVNIFIAAFTTAHARLHLYRRALFLLQPQQVLYMDTDSIIYKHAPGQPTLETGAYLGQFKNELDEGDTIIEFATAGPKNYGYVTRQGKIECKVRGFSLNARGQEQLNFDILKRNVLDELRHPQAQARSIPIFNPHKIVRDDTTKRLQTRTEIKRYQLVASKRVVDPSTFHSYPYGFTPAPQD
ncbi:unnamed protein product, partial [Porites evermanni]